MEGDRQAEAAAKTDHLNLIDVDGHHHHLYFHYLHFHPLPLRLSHTLPPGTCLLSDNDADLACLSNEAEKEEATTADGQREGRVGTAILPRSIRIGDNQNVFCGINYNHPYHHPRSKCYYYHYYHLYPHCYYHHCRPYHSHY